MKKTIFCAHCQADTEHAFRAVGQELIGACPCGREIKFPATLTAAQLRTLISDHRRVNQGQVLAATVEAAESKALETLAEV
jgi:hypothetical protein